MFKVIDTFVLYILPMWIDSIGKTTLQKQLRIFSEGSHRQVLIQCTTLIREGESGTTGLIWQRQRKMGFYAP